MADSKETAKQAAERGTRVHESIERWYGGDHYVEHPEIAKAFEQKVSEHFGGHTGWQTEVAFASELGFGGKVDLYFPATAEAPDGIVLDAKSKEFGPDNVDKVVGYDEHLMQLAAYRHGLGLSNARCANVFASVNNPGLIKVVEWSPEDLNKGWEMFKCLLQFWKLKNNFGLS